MTNTKTKPMAMLRASHEKMNRLLALEKITATDLAALDEGEQRLFEKKPPKYWSSCKARSGIAFKKK
jgi:hypothetical protein